MPEKRASRLVFFLILFVYIGVGVLFAIRTPAWQTPDEPAHYNYMRQVADALTGKSDGLLIPVIQLRDWNNDYLEALKSGHFAPSLLKDLDSVQYEDHQPPLYYWLSTPVFVLTNGNLTALRLMSLAWGLVTLTFSYRIARVVFPDHERIALGTMALVAFIPQHMMILASVNNDALAGAILAVTLYLCLRYRQDGSVPAWQLGLMLGLGFITKTTIYFMVAVVALTVLLQWLATKERYVRSTIVPVPVPDQNRSPMMIAKSALPVLVRVLLVIALVSGVFAAFWWGRNISVYGFPDFIGLRAHDAVVVGQPRTADLIVSVGTGEYIHQLLTTTFNSFWGQFGWMAVPMIGVFAPNDHVIYGAIGVFLLVALMGLVALRVNASLRLTSADNNPHRAPFQRDARRILLTTLLLAILVFLYYNTQFVQFQGRYLFTGVIPFALFVTVGFDATMRLIRFKQGVWLIALLVVLNVYLIWRVIPNALA